MMHVILRACRRRASLFVAGGLILGLFWLTRLPTLSIEERAELGERFRFEPLPLPELPGASEHFRLDFVSRGGDHAGGPRRGRPPQ